MILTPEQRRCLEAMSETKAKSATSIGKECNIQTPSTFWSAMGSLIKNSFVDEYSILGMSGYYRTPLGTRALESE